MREVPSFSAVSLQSIAKVIGDTSNGLSGSEISNILARCEIPDVSPELTKWKRIFDALAVYQNNSGNGKHVIGFITKSISPIAHVTKAERYRWFCEHLNPILAFSLLKINEEGRIAWAKKAASLNEALARANKLKTELERRSSHKAVIEYCKVELLADNYFHAVLEAMKGIASRMRTVSGLQSDGADLVRDMFMLGQSNSPMFGINPLTDESFRSEQKGFVNLLIGMFGMFRNPVAHAARIHWSMSENDALDMLTTISLVHRKLDNAYRIR